METTIVEFQVTSEQTSESAVVEKKKKKTGTKKTKKGKLEATTKTRVDGKKIHVRSVDTSQVQQKFNKVASTESENNAAALLCKLCNKQVFQMERIKAEKYVWHKNCFCCTECQKKLTVDTYNSHEGLIYCKPHFKQLFQPKAVLDADEPYIYKPEMIIRESQPMELPSDVVRASETTSSYSMEELSNLDLKSRFTVFERALSNQQEDSDLKEDHKFVKRSESILSKLARFDRENSTLKGELKSGDQLYEDSSDEGEDGYSFDEAGNRLSYLGPDGAVNFNSISDIKSRWEDDQSGAPRTRKEELARQRKEELQILRARQCQGRQLRLKEQYEQAVLEGREGKDAQNIDLNVDPEKLRSIKDIFEKGGEDPSSASNKSAEHVVDPEKLKQLKNMFELGELSSGEKLEREELILGAATREARNIFKQMEENRFEDQNTKNKNESYGLENKETFKSTSAMLDLFRRLEKEPDAFRGYPEEEEEDYEEDESEGEESGEEEEEVNDSEEENRTIGLTPQQQELLQIAKDRALAKNMREKFERWEFSNDEEKVAYEKTLMIPESEEFQASLNTAKNLRAHFENLQKEPPKPEKPRMKINRFV